MTHRQVSDTWQSPTALKFQLLQIIHTDLDAFQRGQRSVVLFDEVMFHAGLFAFGKDAFEINFATSEFHGDLFLARIHVFYVEGDEAARIPGKIGQRVFPGMRNPA